MTKLFKYTIMVISMDSQIKTYFIAVKCGKGFRKIKTLPGYGSNPNHQTYNQATAIINDNTFETYVNHAIVTGMTLEQYFEDLLLHETMHFCGSDGGNALKRRNQRIFN